MIHEKYISSSRHYEMVYIGPVQQMFIPENVLFEFWLWQSFQLVEGFVVLIVIAMVAPHASALSVRYNDNICSTKSSLCQNPP